MPDIVYLWGLGWSQGHFHIYIYNIIITFKKYYNHIFSLSAFPFQIFTILGVTENR